MGGIGKILMPYAWHPAGRLVAISDFAKTDGIPTCIGCGNPVVAKQGKQVTWHFAHKHVVACDPEGALHKATKLLIAERFANAVVQTIPYRLNWKCAACASVRSADATQLALEVVVEDGRALEGLRPDLFFRGGRRDFAIEVVVTNTVDEAKEAKLARTEVPVFSTRPTWESLKDYEAGVHVSETFNLDTSACPGCRRLRAQARERTTFRESVISTYAALQPQNAQLIRWERSKYGDVLYPHVRSRLYEIGSRLLAAGFTQNPAKPYSFSVAFRKERVAFWASLGGSDVVPIWEDSRPLVWLNGGANDWQKEVFLREGILHCSRFHIATRTSFYEQDDGSREWDPAAGRYRD